MTDLVGRRALAMLLAVTLTGAATAVWVAAGARRAAATTATASTDAELRAALADATVTHIDLTGIDNIHMSDNCAGGTYTRPDIGGDLTIDGHGKIIDASGCTDVGVLKFTNSSGQRLTLQHVTLFHGNLVDDTVCDSGPGAGLRTLGTTVLDHVLVLENSVTNSMPAAGTCGPAGGGVAVQGPLTVISSTISNNSVHCVNCTTPGFGSNGGGIFDAFGPLSLVNSTVSDNQATGSDTYGGGITVRFASTASMRFSTIVANAAGADRNIHDAEPTTPMTSFASVVAEGAGGGNCLGVVSVGYSYEDGSGSGTCGFAATGDHIGAIPLFGPAANNGGPTLTRKPVAGAGTVIDAIPNDQCATHGAENVATDQRDLVRPGVALGACDVGAYELQPASGTSGTFTSLPPHRVLDTRDGTGLTGAFAPQQTRDLVVTGGASTVPDAAVEAVVLNVTATAPSAAGWLTLFPKGAPLPTASNLNFLAGQTVPNLVVVKIGKGAAHGEVSINNTGGNPSAGTVHVVADVVGYYTDATAPAADGWFTPIAPNRILDTRSNLGLTGAFTANQHRMLTVTDGGVHVPDTASAVVMNVTATAPSAAGWLTVSPSGSAFPNASNLNFLAGQTVPNLVVVKVGTGHQVDIANTDVPMLPHPASGTVHVVADVVGYYDTTASTVIAMAPQRILDTRFGTGGVTGPVAPNATITVDPRTATGLPPAGSYTAVIVNVTATGPTQGGWLTAWDTGTIPTASNLNFVAGQTVPNLVKVRVAPDGTFKIANTAFPTGPPPASGTVQVIVDIVGWFQ